MSQTNSSVETSSFLNRLTRERIEAEAEIAQMRAARRLRYIRLPGGEPLALKLPVEVETIRQARECGVLEQWKARVAKQKAGVGEKGKGAV